MLSMTFILDIGSDIYPIPKSTFITDISALKKLSTLRQKACLSVTYELRHEKNWLFAYAKTKTQISFAEPRS